MMPLHQPRFDIPEQDLRNQQLFQEKYKEGFCWEHKALVLSALGWIIRPVDAKTLASVSLSFMIDHVV